MRKIMIMLALAVGATTAQGKDFHFERKVNVGRLHHELLAAGYKVISVVWDDKHSKGFVRLSDADKANPMMIINNHKYISDETIIADRKKAIASSWAEVADFAASLQSPSATEADRNKALLALIRYISVQNGMPISSAPGKSQ